MRQTSIALLLVLFSQPAQPQFVVPSFPDLTIKVRLVRGFVLGPGITTFYLKGPRERIERSLDLRRAIVTPSATINRDRIVLTSATINQCDLGTAYHLHPQNKTYMESHFHNREESKTKELHFRGQPKTGPEVLVTFDSVDTGEQRHVGPYEAHRIKTTVTVEPSKGATTAAAKVEADAWYLDLSGLNCMEQPAPSVFWQPPRYGVNDRITITHNGPEPRGLVIEGAATTRQGGNVIENKAVLIKVSDQALDDSLFEVPPDYVPATPGHQRMLLDSIDSTPTDR